MNNLSEGMIFIAYLSCCEDDEKTSILRVGGVNSTKFDKCCWYKWSVYQY